MYQYQPQKSNNVAGILLLLFALAAFILFSLSVILQAFMGVLQLAAVLCLAPDIAIFLRYFKRSYVYRIQAVKGKEYPDLTVSELSGKNSIVVCRLSLENILSVEKRSSLSSRKLGKHYNYCVDIAPKNAYVLRFFECGENICIIMSLNDTLLSALESFAKENNTDLNV